MVDKQVVYGRGNWDTRVFGCVSPTTDTLDYYSVGKIYVVTPFFPVNTLYKKKNNTFKTVRVK